MPDTADDFDAYMRDTLEGDALQLTAEARELGIQIVMHPPVPLRFRPLLVALCFYPHSPGARLVARCIG